jgi:hypothetical protein
MNTHDGGQAFPTAIPCVDASGAVAGFIQGTSGMSLRDYTSIAFTQSHLAHLMTVQCGETTDERMKEAAIRGLATANHWLAARQSAAQEGG